MKRILWIPFTLAAVALILAGYLAGVRRASVSAPATATTAGVLYWYDPMIPTEHHDQPGLSSMGMQMIPKYAGSEDVSGGVRIDATTMQNLGLRTARATRRKLVDDIRVPGTVNWDLDEASVISARADGVITRLAVRTPYSVVSAGAPVAELTAPAWSSAVAEYTALRQARSPDAQALLGAARERLSVLGLEPSDLHSVGRNGAITLHALSAGIVTRIDVREGQRVNAGQTLLAINGIAKVWVDASLPQALAANAQPGTPVSVRVDSRPGQVFSGAVAMLLPDIDSSTRTQRARIVLDNPQGVLSPGMFAQVTLNPSHDDAVLAIPDEALISTGEQTRVIRQEDNGRFVPVAIRAGRSAGGYTQVIDGLRDGDRLVVSGQFLIDSEASLSGALDRLGSDSAPAPSTSGPLPSMPMQGMEPEQKP
jgi:Cu(I)/Ag(I) efflux system membrane fusion protein